MTGKFNSPVVPVVKIPIVGNALQQQNEQKQRTRNNRP